VNQGSEELDDGDAEPDYRFSLANERTFLAWMRTGLSLLAGAIALQQLVPSFHVTGSRTFVAALLGLAGTATPLFAYRRWMRFQKAMRRRAPLPLGWGVAATAVASAALGIVVTVLVLTAHYAR